VLRILVIPVECRGLEIKNPVNSATMLLQYDENEIFDSSVNFLLNTLLSDSYLEKRCAFDHVRDCEAVKAQASCAE